MDTKEKKLLELIDLYRSSEELNELISSLPRGYISVKSISGHTYYYRQWRDGDRIISKYVESAFVPGVEAKIALRKEHEKVLSSVKKDIKKVQRYLLEHHILTSEDFTKMKEQAKYDHLSEDERTAILSSNLPDLVDTKVGHKFIEGDETYNRLYLISLGLL
ncbi:MAG: hypothetical protein LUB56_02920 [Coprobacillus sp.]|nr:hypothetical protein [Coprobacillus sp.]